MTGKRYRWRASFALCAGALLCVLALPARAPAGPVKLGLIATEPPTELELARMAGIGTDAVRVEINWGLIERSPGVSDWSFYDARIGGIAAAGMKPQPLLLGVPAWLDQRPSHPPIANGRESEAWSNFLRQLVGRYGSNGTFWASNPGIAPAPLTEWEVWNEPNLDGFWDGRPNPRAYGQLLEVTRDALVGADPAAKVFVGGLFRRPQRAYGISMEKFIQRLYKVPGIRASFDGVAIHPYARTPLEALDVMNSARRLLDSKKDRAAHLLITELGWATSGAKIQIAPFRASEKSQAQKLTSTYRILMKSRKRLRLHSIFWHTWRDYDGPGDDYWTLRMGLLRSDGTEKPAFKAFAKLAG